MIQKSGLPDYNFVQTGIIITSNDERADVQGGYILH